MSERRKEAGEERERDAVVSPFESGVLPKGLAEVVEQKPPWDVVHAYLERGEHRYWVEGWAARSPAFRDVLDALRNDHEEHAPPRRSNIVPLKRPR